MWIQSRVKRRLIVDYIIYGNIILLCEGWDSEESLERCNSFIMGIISSDKK